MNTRYRCPNCEHNKTFVRYINSETGEQLSENIGKCERLSNCGFHQLPPLETKCFNVPFESIIDYNAKTFKIQCDNGQSYYLPKSQLFEVLNNGCYVSEWFLLNAEKTPIYFANDLKYYSEGKAINQTKFNIITPPEPKPVSFIPVEVFKESLKDYEANNFIKYLINLFGVEIASELIGVYFIGTSKYWDGATVFYQIDIQGKIRTGKIMLYSPVTGKRVKEPYNHINWVHKAIKQPEFELRQCLFGEHLINQFKSKPIAIVESEKTAVIASVYLPQFIWLAVGSLTNLNAEKCSILKGRTVTLFPDLNGFDKWNIKAQELAHITKFSISDLLERKAARAERQQGFDLADYLIKFDYKNFIIHKPEQPYKRIKPLFKMQTTEQTEPESLEQDIKELETYFSNIRLPAQPIKLNKCSTVIDCSLFIKSHFDMIYKHKGNQTFLPYLNRLEELKQVLILKIDK
jgi:hypothetical protein